MMLRYIPLREGEIRLLRLYAADCKTQFTACLEIWKLDQAPPYSALSYVWGNPAESVSIKVDRNQSADITPNLFRALCTIVRSYKISLMWVDQICINQTDLAEKSRQVQLMGQIYERAHDTVIWLGEDSTEQAPLVFDFFTRLERMCLSRTIWEVVAAGSWSSLLTSGVKSAITRSWVPFMHFLDKTEVDRTKIKQHVDADINSLLTPEIANAISNFCQLSWFKRTWILQEAVISKNARLIWGNHELAWGIFRTVFVVCTVSNSFIQILRERVSPLQQVHIMRRLGFIVSLAEAFDSQRDYGSQAERPIKSYDGHSKDELSSCLSSSVLMECKIPHDRIIALLGICKDVPDITTDYELSEADFFRDVAVRIITQPTASSCNCPVRECRYNKLSVFRHINRLERQEHIPSWVPTWQPDTSAVAGSNLDEIAGVIIYNSSKGTASTINICSQPNLIQVRGKIWDRVVAFGAVIIPSHSLDFSPDDERKVSSIATTNIVIQEARRLASECHAYGNAKSRFESLWRTLTINVSRPLGYGPPFRIDNSQTAADLENYFLDYVDLLDHIYKAIAADNLHEAIRIWKDTYARANGTEWEMRTVFTEATSNRRFFVTEQGYMGLGPAQLCKNDRISIFLGGSLPVVLREVPDGTYKYISECYVHGIMNGEVVEMDDYPECFITIS